jgi:hypothetical protein
MVDLSGHNGLGRPNIFVLDKDEFICGFTLEEVTLPDNLAAAFKDEVDWQGMVSQFTQLPHTSTPSSWAEYAWNYVTMVRLRLN